MSLHNDEYHAMANLRRAAREAVKKVAESSEIYLRIKGYIKLANDKGANLEYTLDSKDLLKDIYRSVF